MARQYPLHEHLERNIQRDPNSGCWLWCGSMLRTGYGRLKRDGVHQMAHRAVYEFYRGPIPIGLVIDHKCRTPACVSPHHLRAVTNEVNVLENSLSFVAANKAKTHCSKGHALDGDNLQIVWRGRTRPSRRCRICTLAHQKKTDSRPEAKRLHAQRERERRARLKEKRNDHHG